jgi:Lon protease-like protein
VAETGTLRLFPLNTVLFPRAVVSLHVFEERYRMMIAECLDAGEAFGVVLIRDGL